MSAGSSPQARGTLATTSPTNRTLRFIPAGAGNTEPLRLALEQAAVHPRRRGEHRKFSNTTSAGRGSSPQARGTPSAPSTKDTPSRFIPAGAGNTFRSAVAASPSPVHPRRRGEHSGIEISLLAAGGSSPQARGTRPGGCPACSCRRFIPAGAGNTDPECSGRRLRTVHPRRRGEHFSARAKGWGNSGSSPQARGTPPWRAAPGARYGFIPAGAGNTCSRKARSMR